MKKYYNYLFMLLVSFFFINLNDVKALNTTCANVILENGEYHIILNNNDIEINSSTIDASKMTQIDLMVSLWANKRWYIFEDNGNGNVVVVLTNWWAQGGEASSQKNIKYIHNSVLNSYDFIVFEISNNSIISTTIRQKYSSYFVYSFSSSRGTAINSNTGGFAYGSSNPSANTYTFEESATCNYSFTPKIDITFDYIEQHIQPNNGEEILSKIGANIHTTVSNCDISSNNIYYSFDNGNTYTQANSCSFDLTVYKNTDFYVKVTDLENNVVDSSMLSLTQILDPNNYMNITYEDAITESDYVEVEGEKILNNGRFKVSFKVPNIENYSYICDFEFINNSYNYTKDLTDLLIENNQLYTNIDLIYSGNLHCKILDKNKNILFENYSDTLLLNDREKLGPYVTYEKKCSEDNSSCTLNFDYLNFDSINYKYYYSLDNGFTLIENTQIINNSYLNKWQYVFNTNGSIMIIIKDLNENVLFSNIFIIDDITPIISNKYISFNIQNIFKYFSKNISEVFKLITYFFNNLPLAFQNMFYMIFILIVGLMIFRFLV